MGLKLNPLTAQFDLTGSGGGQSYIDGEVATYNDLPLSGTTAPLDSAWLVRGSSGIWPFTKPGGVYIRTATGGSSRDADYTYAGVFPDVFSDAQFTLYDDADTSKNLKFQLSGISTGTTRTLTVPNASGRIQVEGQPIGNTTPSTGAFTTLSASGSITAAAGTAGTPTTPATALGVQWSGLGGTDIAAVYGTYSGAGKVGIGVGTSGILTEVASFALGGIALNRATTVSNGTLTASAPVLDLSQTWNNAAVTFTGLRFNVTNTASATASPLIDLQVGGVSRMRMTRGGTLHLSEHSNSGLYSPAPVWTGSTAGLLAATNLAVGSSLDTILERGGAGILEQRNAANAQTFRLYNTFTDASNYERAKIAWSSNVLQIGTEKAGTGSARALEFQTDGTTRFTLSTTGAATFTSTVTANGTSNGFETSSAPNGASPVRFSADSGNVLIQTALNPGITEIRGITATNPQTVRIFNTRTSSTNFERLNIRWASNECIIDAEAGSGGGTLRGIKIGSATTQPLGFWNATPAAQPAAVADATDAASTQARLNDLLARLRTIGIIAT